MIPGRLPSDWASGCPEPNRGLASRPLVLLAPNSFLGGIYAAGLMAGCKNVAAAVDGKFRHIHAFEADRGNFDRLQSVRLLGLPNVTLHNTAVGDYTGCERFAETGWFGSRVDETGGNRSDVPIVRLDDVLDEVTFIKMDLEGFEQRALKGAERLIRQCRPRMAITAYHYADDLLDLWRLFGELAPDYELRLRHHSNY